ncbi:hypothetical protein [uncultured Desulfobacter sp.]|uniref:hypothetical protein n=1 Tax=uncultured Desulfobacter sp. TaxID=240139 RepID=UPI0029F45DD8|nr:hypothetical protein [uncultured Desulfobacter sp.]
MHHDVFRQNRLRVDASSWHKSPWDDVSSRKLNCHMGEYPLHFPGLKKTYL